MRKKEYKSVAEIAEIFGCSESKIYQLLCIGQPDDAIVLKNGRSSLYPGAQQFAQEYHDDEETITQLCDKYHVKPSTIASWWWMTQRILYGKVQAKRAQYTKTTKNPGYNELYRLYMKEDLSYRAIAKIYNVSAETVHNWMSQTSPNLTAMKKAKRREHDNDIVREYFEENATAKQLSQKYNLSQGKVEQIVRIGRIRAAEEGVEYKRKRSKRPDDQTLLAMYFDQNMTGQKIANLFSVHRETAYKWIREAEKRASIPGKLKKSYSQCCHKRTPSRPGDEELLKEYVKGWVTYRELATKYHVAPCTIGTWINAARKRLDVEPESQSGRRKDNVKK